MGHFTPGHKQARTEIRYVFLWKLLSIPKGCKVSIEMGSFLIKWKNTNNIYHIFILNYKYMC